MKSASQRRSPYQGLIPYEENDAPFFFGREKEMRVIAANLFAAQLTLLYGPSGVGKSSILRAGVINHLRARDDVLVVEFHTWQTEPLGDLQAAIAEAMASANGQDVPPTDSPSLAENLAACTARLDRRFMVILDQFEEYFLYHPQDDAFAQEFPTAVMQADAPVSFLIAIREDALAKLDRFEGRIPILFDNYLRIEHLDRKAARAAITEPIKQYNHLYAQDAEQIAIEPKLVEAVLEQVETGQVILGEAGRGMVKGQAIDAHIETPYLQLVMTRLWDEELRADSHILRLETMDRLGGAERIVRTHLDAVMSTLLPDEQEIAASIFHYLVTPSGTKIAHAVSDLAEYAQLPQMHLSLVLEKLCRGDVRILRPVAPLPDQPTMLRYEIFHDVLATAILDWQARYLKQQELAETERREAVRQRELEQAQTLAEEQRRRAEEQARVAGRMRRRLLRLLLILPFVLAAIVSAPLALLKKSSEAEIILKVSQVAFTLGEQGTNGLLNAINVVSLRLQNFRTIELGPSALEIAAASGWQRIRTGGQMLITSKGAFTSATLADVTLNELGVTPGVRVTLSSVEGEPRTLTVRIDGGTTTGKIAVSERLHLSCDYCEVNDLPAQYDFDSKVLRLTPERQHEIGFSGRNETMTLTLELAPQAMFALKNVPVTAVDLTKQGEERSRTSTVIDNGGKIIFREFDEEGAKIEEDDFVILDGLKNFRIKSLQFDGALNLVLHGQVSKLATGPAGFIRDRLPSLLEWLYAREAWVLYVQALILTAVTVLAIFQRLKILREEE